MYFNPETKRWNVKPSKNSLEAPVASRTPKTLSRKLGMKERTYINFCDQYYHENSVFPTPDTAAAQLNYHLTEINYFLTNKQVQEALERRGLPWKFAQQETLLSPIQLAAAITVLNFADTRHITTKLEELGVTTEQYYAWLSHPPFRRFVERVSERNLEILKPEAITAFSQLVRNGDFNAIKYYFELTGVSQSPEILNAKLLVQRLIDSVNKHVKDPATLVKIGKDLWGTLPGGTGGATVEIEVD